MDLIFPGTTVPTTDVVRSCVLPSTFETCSCSQNSCSVFSSHGPVNSGWASCRHGTVATFSSHLTQLLLKWSPGPFNCIFLEWKRRADLSSPCCSSYTSHIYCSLNHTKPLSPSFSFHLFPFSLLNFKLSLRCVLYDICATSVDRRIKREKRHLLKLTFLSQLTHLRVTGYNLPAGSHPSA